MNMLRWAEAKLAAVRAVTQNDPSRWRETREDEEMYQGIVDALHENEVDDLNAFLGVVAEARKFIQDGKTVKDFEGQIDDLNQEIRELEDERDHLRIDFEDAKDKIEVLEEEIEKLTDQVNDRAKELAELEGNYRAAMEDRQQALDKCD
jgi:chromosome segregation ATPase